MNPRRWKYGNFLAHFNTPRGGSGWPWGGGCFVFDDFRGKIMIFEAKTMFFTLPTSFASFSVTVWSYELIFKLVTSEIIIFCFRKLLWPEKIRSKKIFRSKKNPVAIFFDFFRKVKNFEKFFFRKSRHFRKNFDFSQFSTFVRFLIF